jgi:hypothetical protein
LSDDRLIHCPNRHGGRQRFLHFGAILRWASATCCSIEWATLCRQFGCGREIGAPKDDIERGYKGAANHSCAWPAATPVVHRQATANCISLRERAYRYRCERRADRLFGPVLRKLSPAAICDGYPGGIHGPHATPRARRGPGYHASHQPGQPSTATSGAWCWWPGVPVWREPCRRSKDSRHSLSSS